MSHACNIVTCRNHATPHIMAGLLWKDYIIIVLFQNCVEKHLEDNASDITLGTDLFRATCRIVTGKNRRKHFITIMAVTRVRSGRSDPPAFGNNLIRHLLEIKDLWFYPTPDKIISESPDLPDRRNTAASIFILITTRVRPFQHNNIRVYYTLHVLWRFMRSECYVI